MGAHDATIVGLGGAQPDVDLAHPIAVWLGTALEHTGAREARLFARRQFRWSEHLLYDLPGSAIGRALIKRVKSHDRQGRTQGSAIPPRIRTLAEFGALETIHRIVTTSSVAAFTSVEPLACFQDLDAFAMEYRPGPTVRTLVARASSLFGRDLARAEAGAGRAGGWLALLHGALAGQRLERAIEGRAQALHVAAELETLVAPALRLDAPVPAAACAMIAARLAAHGTIWTVPLHGDFYPDNVVIASDGSLYAIDTTLLASGPAEDDLARFMVGVDTLRSRIVLGDLFVRRGRLARIQRAFLAGYGATRAIDPELLIAAVARAYLLRWAELRAAAALDRPPAIVALGRHRIDRFMSARLSSFLADPETRVAA